MKEPRPQKRKRADLFETARSLATRWKKRLQSRRRKKDAKDERDKLARQSEWRAISRAYLESRGLKFIADVEGNDSFFLMSGQTEALKDIVKKPDPSVKPGKWLVLTDIAGDKPVPFEEANTRLADLAADGVVWVSTLRTRHSMHRKIPKNLDAPYALFSLKDVDQCVNLGAAGSAYLQHFRKKFSAEYSAEDTFFAAVTFLSMVIGFWFAIVIGVHTDWSGSLLRSALKAYGLLIIPGAVFVAILLASQGIKEGIRRFGLLVLVSIIPILAIAFVGSYNWLRDTLIAMVLAGLIFFWPNAKRPGVIINPPDSSSKDSFASRQRLGKIATWAVLVWICLSIADRGFGPGWWIQQSLQTDRSSSEAGSNPPVAAALSGGGYRAAILHAGVLRALEDLHLRVSAVSTISGGSIIGSFYALGGEPEAFAGAVKSGRFNLKRELYNVLELVPLACPGELFSLNFWFFCDAYARSDVQAKMLDRVLLGGAKLPDTLAVPKLMIGATDLQTGALLGFSRDGLLRIPQSGSSDSLEDGSLPRKKAKPKKEPLGNLKDLDLSHIVAGSGAFPGAINSMDVVHEVITEPTQCKEPTQCTERTKYKIGDGGLADNYGLSLLLAAHEKLGADWQQKLIIVSDGSKPLEEDDDVSGLMEFLRGMDVVYASSGLDDFKRASEQPMVLRLAPANFEPLIGEESPEGLKTLLARLPRAFLRTRDIGTGSTEDLKQDIRKSVATFHKVSTLKDQFGRSPWSYLLFWEEQDQAYFHGLDQVDALFALGIYLVYHQCGKISEGLGIEEDLLCKEQAAEY